MITTPLNENLTIAMNHMKKDILKVSGSCIFITCIDDKIIQVGGGDGNLIQFLLDNAKKTITDKPTTVIQSI
jgi:hypothetical protein